MVVTKELLKYIKIAQFNTQWYKSSFYDMFSTLNEKTNKRFINQSI